MIHPPLTPPIEGGEQHKRMKKPITLILLGDIAAGKGTQARILAKKFGLKLIDSGVYSRKIWHTKRGARVKEGKLAPSDVIQKYLQSELSKISKVRGVLVDGGKMPAEARLINQLFKRQGRKFFVIYLTIPKSEIYKRLKIRIQKEQRADDSPQAIRNRMDYYKKIYSKTVKFWKSKRVLRKVNGTGSVEVVNSRITKVIKNHFL